MFLDFEYRLLEIKTSALALTFKLLCYKISIANKKSIKNFVLNKH